MKCLNEKKKKKKTEMGGIGSIHRLCSLKQKRLDFQSFNWQDYTAEKMSCQCLCHCAPAAQKQTLFWG